MSTSVTFKELTEAHKLNYGYGALTYSGGCMRLTVPERLARHNGLKPGQGVQVGWGPTQRIYRSIQVQVAGPGSLAVRISVPAQLCADHGLSAQDPVKLIIDGRKIWLSKLEAYPEYSESLSQVIAVGRVHVQLVVPVDIANAHGFQEGDLLTVVYERYQGGRVLRNLHGFARAVTLPMSLVHDLKLTSGDYVFFTLYNESRTLTLQKVIGEIPTAYTPPREVDFSALGQTRTTALKVPVVILEKYQTHARVLGVDPQVLMVKALIKAAPEVDSDNSFCLEKENNL
jgi:bifunctional DNA-binding transcriptional regulator/antitoxin component of YhaV-PrlF toxin-antitoxin module